MLTQNNIWISKPVFCHFEFNNSNHLPHGVWSHITRKDEKSKISKKNKELFFDPGKKCIVECSYNHKLKYTCVQAQLTIFKGGSAEHFLHFFHKSNQAETKLGYKSYIKLESI